jgi:hypothetical protein
MSHRIITSIPPNLICSDGLYEPRGPQPDACAYHAPECTWEPPSDASDARPTFREAVEDYRTHCTLIMRQIIIDAHLGTRLVYATLNCTRIPSRDQRTRLAAMLGMHPEQIRWPVSVKEAR